MKELKVILSPNYSKDEFLEEVSGIEFRKSRTIEVYGISLEDNKLSGIQSALRKNILIPYDKKTLDFVNGKNIAGEEKQEVKVEVKEEKAPVEEKPEKEEPAVKVEEPKAEETKEEPKAEKKAPAKTTRKRTVKKETAKTAE